MKYNFTLHSKFVVFLDEKKFTTTLKNKKKTKYNKNMNMSAIVKKIFPSAAQHSTVYGIQYSRT
jgi:hypothetical protein